MESTIGKRIRQLREAKGLSVADFAKCAGVKPSAIYGLESDANKPSIETVAMLRQSFPDMNSEWLQFGDGPMLRDGRYNEKPTLVAPQEPTPSAGLVSGPATDTLSYGDAVELAVANARIADRDETIRQQQFKIDELNRELGKPFNGLDAAGSSVPATPRTPIGFALSVSNRVKQRGAARSL